MLVDRIGVQSKKIVWVSPLIVDIHFHKTSRLEILRALSKRGHRVGLIASYSSKNDPNEMLGVPTLLVPLRYAPKFSPSMYTILLSIALPILFLRSRPDYAIVEPDMTVLGMATTFLLPKSIRPKIILDIRSTPVNISGLKGFLKCFFFNFAVHVSKKFFQGITIITEMMKKEVCQVFDIDPQSVGVWTSGVSPAFFNPQNYDGASIKKDRGLDGKFVVFYHGPIIEKRGIPQTIKAIQILKNKYPDLFLFLLGKGTADTYFKRLIQELEVEKMVIIHSSVSYAEVPKYISMCEAGLVPLPNLPDWRNQCPLNLLEYLAMKKPVIATDIPANREILGNCKCGIYASSANAEEIARALAYACENRAEVEGWGAFGRTIVEERYTWNKVAESFETYLLKL